jgi:hypothetical protein
VVENLKTLLIQLFLRNWQRKLISLILAMIIWMVISHSMTVNKVISNIPVRVTNLPPEKTIEGMQVNGLLNKKISLTVTGNKTALDEITGKDLEVVIDASNKTSDWIATISKKNLISLNPEFDMTKISRVHPVEMSIRQSKLVTEKIPVLVTQPIGEPPKGYQFLDVWPYQLSVTVNGPEEAVKRLKSRGLKLTFNLSDISRNELETLHSSKQEEHVDEISYFVPNSWKKIALPSLSETPIEIDDPQAKALRIDFSRQDLLPIGFSIPVSVYYPPKYCHFLNPDTYTLGTNDFIVQKHGVKFINPPLYAQGVSRLFLETVKDMIEMVIIAGPHTEKDSFLWNAQFIHPQELENHYIAKVMSESSDEVLDVQPHLLEDYLRNRFRSYMHRFRLYSADHHKLTLQIELSSRKILVTPTINH